ncbi:MAG: TIGR03749 family integrating conjugative element protein, partial [Candidatus Rokuibacteriota bacterium]
LKAAALALGVLVLGNLALANETLEWPEGLGLEDSALGIAAAPTPAPIEHLRWSGTPMPLVLPIGIDRVVRFPSDVRVGPPGKLSERLQVTSADGAVYFRALAAFEPTLVLAQETEPPGRTFSFELRAEQGASTTPVEILAPREEPRDVSAPAESALDAEIAPSPRPYGYVALTRFAAQQLYAPERLLRALDGMYRVPVPDRGLVALIRTGAVLGEVDATPLASWADETGLYVTAVRLRNRTHRPVVLDPRTALRGEWLAATFQHARLFPAGHEADTTAVYLISAQPFTDALGRPRRGR